MSTPRTGGTVDLDELLRHGGVGWEAVADELLKQYPSVKYPGSVMGSPGALATYALEALRRVAKQRVRPK